MPGRCGMTQHRVPLRSALGVVGEARRVADAGLLQGRERAPVQRDAVDDRHVLQHHHPCQLVGKGDPVRLGQQADAQAVVDPEDVLAGDGRQQPRLRPDAEDRGDLEGPTAALVELGDPRPDGIPHRDRDPREPGIEHLVDVERIAGGDPVELPVIDPGTRSRDARHRPG